MSQITGRVTIKLDGDQLRSEAGASIDPGGWKRDYSMSDQAEFGFKEMPIPCIIDCEIRHMSDTDILALRDVRAATVQFETDTGIVYTTTPACVAEVGPLKDGKVPVKFAGPPATQS